MKPPARLVCCQQRNQLRAQSYLFSIKATIEECCHEMNDENSKRHLSIIPESNVAAKDIAINMKINMESTSHKSYSINPEKEMFTAPLVFLFLVLVLFSGLQKCVFLLFYGRTLQLSRVRNATRLRLVCDSWYHACGKQ